MRLGIENHQSKLAKDGELQSCISEGPTDFKHQVGIGGRRHEFISAPLLHHCIELVVRAIRASIEYSLIKDGLKAFSAPVRDEYLLGSNDLCGHRSRRRPF